MTDTIDAATEAPQPQVIAHSGAVAPQIPPAVSPAASAVVPAVPGSDAHFQGFVPTAAANADGAAPPTHIFLNTDDPAAVSHPQEVIPRRTKPVYTQADDAPNDAYSRRPTYTTTQDSPATTLPQVSAAAAVSVVQNNPVNVASSMATDVFTSTGTPGNQFLTRAPVLGFSGEYMPQPDAAVAVANDAAQNFAPRFEGDAIPNVVYEIPKEIKTNADATQVVTTAAMVPNQMSVQAVGLPKSPGTRIAAAPPPLPYGGETVDKCVECEVCGSLFGDAGSLKRHAARAHRAATGKGPVYCSQCSASLKNEQNLRRHIAVCHSGSQENRCDMCSASFSSRGSLRIHQQTVHSVPSASKNGRKANGRPRGGVTKPKAEKSFLCDMCTDTFKWKGNLKRHRELRHLQLRPFECHICHASFGTKSNMRVHLITHQNNAGGTGPAMQK